MAFRSPLGPMQAAVYTALHTDATLTALAPIYDQVPEGATTNFPYVRISSLDSAPDNTLGDQGRIVTVTINAWSEKPGNLELQTIQQELLRLLDETPIVADPAQGWSIWYNLAEAEDIALLSDGLTREATVRVQIGCQKIALGE